MSEIKELTPADIRAWAKELHAQGSTLKLCWDGGGDSGWAYFEIDGEQRDTPETEYLVDMCYGELDYGSWAGEFSASGEALYNPEEEAFVGTDNYSTEEYENINDEDALLIEVPTCIKVDGLEVNIESDGDEATLTLEIKVTHGFKTPEYKKIEREIEQKLLDKYYKIVDKYSRSGNTYTPASCNQVFTKADLELSTDGEYWIATWDDIDVNKLEGEDRDIVLSLKDTEDNE